jgi:hypothetical protein
MLSGWGRPAFPAAGALAFGTAVAAVTHAAPAGHPLQPDPLLTVPVALVGSVTGWVLIQVTNWVAVAAVTTLLAAGAVASAWAGGGPGATVALTPVVGLAALAWARRLAHGEADLDHADLVNGVRVLGGRWAVEPGPLPGSDAGGFSLVHLAEDLRHPGSVAVVKLPNPEAREQARARLAREQELLRRCRGPHVAAFLDAGVDQASGVLYLVTAWYPHGSLSRRMDRLERFPLGWAMDVADAVLAGLVSLHEGLAQPVVHRDVNPRNVLLTGTSTVAVLSDFGSARYLTGPAGLDDTITLAVPYSPWYAAPELVHMRASWGPATDVYGAAAILYELVTGLPPYVRESQASGLGFPELAERRQPPSSAGGHNRRLPPALVALLDDCLAAEPGQRPPRAAEVKAAMRATRSATGDASVVPFAQLRAGASAA